MAHIFQLLSPGKIFKKKNKNRSEESTRIRCEICKFVREEKYRIVETGYDIVDSFGIIKDGWKRKFSNIMEYTTGIKYEIHPTL